MLHPFELSYACHMGTASASKSACAPGVILRLADTLPSGASNQSRLVRCLMRFAPAFQSLCVLVVVVMGSYQMWCLLASDGACILLEILDMACTCHSSLHMSCCVLSDVLGYEMFCWGGTKSAAKDFLLG